ncbi:hypothetical protein KDX38_28670, partial [Pseudomonas sp. CDFA 602]|uniref:hypothetical protein n=1 Tax=Pseudomonas californiensis TaxID=2829823 RepID=UPI001E386F4F
MQVTDFEHEKEYLNAQYSLPAFHPHMLNAFPATTFQEGFRQLYSEKTLWMVASWDMYGDEFIRCLENEAEIKRTWINLDITDYKNLDHIFENVNGCSGFRMQEFRTILAAHPEHGLLIDNVPADTRISGNSVIDDVLTITGFIREKAPNISIVGKRSINPTWLKIGKALSCEVEVRSSTAARLRNP